jgi:uncharacterized protein (TIGR02246 family)
MRVAAVVVAFTVSFSVVAAQQKSQPADAGGTEAEIVRLDRDYHEARSRNDAAAINRFLAPDYYTVNTNGERREAGNQSGGPVVGGLPWTKVGVCEHRVRVYGDTALSTYRRQIVSQGPRGGTGHTDLIVTHACVKRDGRWWLALSQATEIAEPQPEGTCQSTIVLPK